VNAPIERVLRALGEAGVRSLIVGGVAVVMHGFLRATADLDLVLDLAPENVRRAIDVFEREGFRPRPPVPLRSFENPEARRVWKEEKNLLAFSLWHPHEAGFEVDLLIDAPSPFQEMWERGVSASVGDVTVRVVAIDDLVTMKRGSTRAQDAEDVEALLRLKEEHERRNK
jgi:predicted nucleotidyltransferase